jgi:hypothetical protein
MAGKTDVLFILSQSLIVVRGMGKMTAETAVTGKGCVLGFRIVHLLNKFYMAITAECGPVINEVIRKLGSMGQVTLFTGFFYRLVNIFFLKVLFLVLVTTKAEVNPIDCQKKFIFGCMGVVADNTITTGHGTVHIVLSSHVVLVTVKADIRQGFFRKQEFGIRLVRIMTDDTLPFLNRQMICLAL